MLLWFECVLKNKNHVLETESLMPVLGGGCLMGGGSAFIDANLSSFSNPGDALCCGF
jgi:hypothetical protein